MPAKLTQYRLCPRSRSIRLALGEQGIDVHLLDETPWQWRQELLARNPAGELPVLQIDGLTLCGVYAISEYLAEAPLDDVAAPGTARAQPLIPGTRDARAEVRRLIDWFHGKFDREVSRELLVEKVYQRLREGGGGAPDPEILRVVRINLRYHLSYLNYLTDHRRWLAGEEFSFADLAAAAQISSIDYLGEMLWSDYPAVKAWYQRVKSRPSFRPLLADRIPGMAPPAVYADLDF